MPIVTPALQRSKNSGLDLVGVDDIAQMWNIIESNHDPEVDPINPWFTPISEMREEWYETLPAGAITIISGAFELFEEDIIKLSQVIKVSVRLHRITYHWPTILMKRRINTKTKWMIMWMKMRLTLRLSKKV